MVEGTEKIKKVVSQKTLDAKRIRLGSKGKRVQCEHCKSRVFDIIRHLERCHLNLKNSPKIEIDWEYWEEFDIIKDHLIKNPTTDKMKEYNQILAPQGNPHERFLDEMLSYAKSLPNTHKDKAINQKLDEIFTSRIEVRLLNKEEYIEKLKEKVSGGFRVFLFDPIKPTTVEEIERRKDELWGL
jgi:hypothetical protein